MNQPNSPTTYTTGNPELDNQIVSMLQTWGVSSDQEIYREMVTTIYKLFQTKPKTADIKQFNKVIKEMRYANKVFAPYHGIKKISIFGSARTSPEAAEYQAARDFARMMMEVGYMVITGGGEGIMGAAQEGAGRERSFGLNIHLPFEQAANKTIDGDEKLITFKYFFTRKLNFIKHSDAIALFPGGFGTMDEGFEAITLMQTGKSPIVPLVMVDAKNGNYWRTFERYLREHLLRDGLISDEDFHLFKITNDLEEARREIQNFYYNFHSSRYLNNQLVIRLQREIPAGAIPRLKEDFKDILKEENGLDVCYMLPNEINEPEFAHLPRLCLNFNRRNYGRLRQLIDRLNLF